MLAVSSAGPGRPARRLPGCGGRPGRRRNLLVLAAFGALAPLRFRVLTRVPVLLGVAAAGSLAVETLQYALMLGRVSLMTSCSKHHRRRPGQPDHPALVARPPAGGDPEAAGPPRS